MIIKYSVYISDLMQRRSVASTAFVLLPLRPWIGSGPFV